VSGSTRLIMGASLRHTVPVNRAELKRLAESRLRDAEVLFAGRCYSGSYYLAGHVVECALKACIAKNTRRGEFPNLQTVQKSYTHNLRNLLGLAGLESASDTRAVSNPSFARNWALVVAWSETSRYEEHNRAEARDLLIAVADPQNGVLPWLRTLW